MKNDWKDDIFTETHRKYRMIQNDDGTVSFEDVTEYTQQGDAFGAKELNAIGDEVNEMNKNLGDHSHDASDIDTGEIPVEHGGTGATTAEGARANLGLSYGSAAGTVCQGNDSRLSDARTPTAHKHAAGDINSGTLGVARGGTGVGTMTSGAALIGNGTGAPTFRAITNLAAKGAASASTNLATANTVVYHAQNRLNRTGAVNEADTGYATYMARGIALVTAEPSSLANGACAFVYS